MTLEDSRVLLIGFGNPGRLDDGLGPALAQELEERNFANVTIDANYQLTVEDSAVVAENDIVIFADASVNGPEPFYFKRIHPNSDIGFSTHHIEPEAILGLARDLFGAKSQGFVLGIRGYHFNEFGEGLSEAAKRNLTAALKFMEQALRSRRFIEFQNNAENNGIFRSSFFDSCGLT